MGVAKNEFKKINKSFRVPLWLSLKDPVWSLQQLRRSCGADLIPGPGTSARRRQANQTTQQQRNKKEMQVSNFPCLNNKAKGSFS